MVCSWVVIFIMELLAYEKEFLKIIRNVHGYDYPVYLLIDRTNPLSPQNFYKQHIEAITRGYNENQIMEVSDKKTFDMLNYYEIIKDKKDFKFIPEQNPKIRFTTKNKVMAQEISVDKSILNEKEDFRDLVEEYRSRNDLIDPSKPLYKKFQFQAKKSGYIKLIPLDPKRNKTVLSIGYGDLAPIVIVFRPNTNTALILIAAFLKLEEGASAVLFQKRTEIVDILRKRLPYYKRFKCADLSRPGRYISDDRLPKDEIKESQIQVIKEIFPYKKNSFRLETR